MSVDDHVVEPPDVWTSRVSTRFRDRCPRVLRDSYEVVFHADSGRTDYVKGGSGPVTDWWHYDGWAQPISMVVACAGIPVAEHSTRPIAFEEMRRGCYDPAARLADMDMNHTERSMCFPYVTRFCGQIFLEAEEKDLAAECVRAYNDWMVEEWCSDSGGRLIPVCIIPLWDPPSAAQEIRRNAARGCRAVTFPEMPHHLGLPSIHDPSGYWDPVFDACSETGTVLCMHIGSGSKMVEVSPFAPRAVLLTLTFSMAQLSLVEWLVSGVLVRFPALKIAYSESQVGWMPFVLERIDKVFTHSNFAAIPDIVTEPPSSYIPGRVFGCFFDDETGILNRHAVGVDQMLFEVDYPHQDTTWPNTMSVVESFAPALSDIELEKILRTNALTMLGLQ